MVIQLPLNVVSFYMKGMGNMVALNFEYQNWLFRIENICKETNMKDEVRAKLLDKLSKLTTA